MIEISVIICTHNREKHLSNALKAIAEQTYDKDKYEIIVIDNNSTDNTEIICNEFKLKHSKLNFRRIFEKKPGLSNARNRGITSSVSDIIAFIDDDAIPQKDYVEKINYYTQLYIDYSYFGGKIIPKYEAGTTPVWLSKYLEKIVSKVDLGEKVRPFPHRSYPVGCNMIFRKSILDKFGYFNPDLQQRADDKFIYYLLKKHNVPPLYCPGIVVEHFIEKERVTRENVIKIATRNGYEEHIRLGGLTTFKGILKLCDYIFKLAASFLLALRYLSRPEKGYYLIMVFWASLKGFVFGINKTTKYKSAIS